jgi:hypothetical protein
MQISDISGPETPFRGDYLQAYKPSRVSTESSQHTPRWVFLAAHYIAEYDGVPANRVRELRAFARAVFYGHPEGAVQDFLAEDTRRELLRDDVVLLWKLLGWQGFERAKRRGIASPEVERLVRAFGIQTRMPEPEVAEVASRIFKRLHDA